MKKSVEVYCTLQVEGTHSWPGCPFDEVAYLRDEHRHVFHIKAYAKVNHNDRDIEFIMLKHQIADGLKLGYFDETTKLHRFGAKSCEMLANELIFNFRLSRCEVSEDGENGAVVEVTEEDPTPTKKLDIECGVCGGQPSSECPTCPPSDDCCTALPGEKHTSLCTVYTGAVQTINCEWCGAPAGEICEPNCMTRTGG